MLAVLIPLAALTVVGLVALWPDDLSEHVREDVSAYTTKDTQILTAEILKTTSASCDGMPGTSDPATTDPNAPPASQKECGTARALLLEGPEKGQDVEVALTPSDMDAGADPGQTIRVYRYYDASMEGSEPIYQFADYERSTPLIVLTIVFALAVVIVVRWRGLASLIGLAFAGFVLIKFMFPALVSGANPVLIGLVASSAIMFVVLYTSHGFSVRTSTALLGTLFGLGCTALIGWVVNDWADLTGVAGEDDFLLTAAAPDLNLTAVVLCGIIVAGLGVLNDVTITQASAVWELADAGDDARLFSKAMRIGRDHIASSVYTIAFATAGAGLSSLLLIAIINRPILDVIQTEALSQEIVRTLVGAIGLVIAMPLTTAVGVAAVRATRALRPHDPGPAHDHASTDSTSTPSTDESTPASTTGRSARTSGSPDRERRRRRRAERANDWESTSDWLDPRR